MKYRLTVDRITCTEIYQNCQDLTCGVLPQQTLKMLLQLWAPVEPTVYL